MSSGERRTRGHYCGDALRAVAMPLGGLGTGSIAIAGDGSLRQWQIHNQINHLACVPHSFFAVWSQPYKPLSEPVARVLQSAALYDSEGPTSPPTSNDHVVPPAHRRLLSELPGVNRIEFTGGYPIAELHYIDDDLPLEVALEAFNPFIPLQCNESGIPGILFNVTVTNPTERVVLSSVAATLQNVVGWDGVAPITDTSCSQYGGNHNGLLRFGEQTIITMGNAWLPGDAAGMGTMALAVGAPDATYLTQWNDLRTFWADFVADGCLSNVSDSSPSTSGHTWNGALAVPMRLQSGETRTIEFTLAWHFPNRYVNYSQLSFFGFDDDRSKFWLGNHYNRRFRSAVDVVASIDRDRTALTRQTRLARDTFYDTTLPFPLIDAVTSQMSVSRTPICFWVEGGAFYGFEGGHGASTPHADLVGGSCPLNCTHVWNYEMALARLFPDLERSMRDTEWDVQQHPSGYVPHRVLLPTYLPRPWGRKIGGPANPALDGLLGAMLKTYREYLASGDAAWLDHAWPAVKLALSHVWEAHDPDRTGVIEGEQPNTYDISIYGANTFIGTLYLAALRTVEEIARCQGEEELAAECRAVFERGREGLEQRLWNGEYYIQEVDFSQHPNQNWGTGCHTDQLFGQWWAHLLGLGYLLDPDHVRIAVKSIVAYNFRESFAGHRQAPRVFVTDNDQGLLICTWPRGGRPIVPTQYSDEVWTGLEYEVAALLLQEGEPELALDIVGAIRTRYDGRKQNPWNDIECGDHYVRAMASWSLLEAASGYVYDAAKRMIGFAPVIGPDAFRAPFFGHEGWGTVEQTVKDGRQTLSLMPASGSVSVATLRMRPLVAGRQCHVALDQSVLAVQIAETGRDILVELSKPVAVETGCTLTATLSA
jgi:non-lysosomal glucosylceramidase